MKLFTKSIDEQLFKQYSMGADLENQKVVAKIFNPYGRGTWYIINSDPNDPDYLWAIVDLFEIEIGSVSRMDLETIKVPPFRLGLERDTSFDPKNAQEVYRGLLSGKQYAEGGMSDSVKEVYDRIDKQRLMVRSKVALAIGIDNALTYLDKEYVVSPFKLLEGAVSRGFITVDEIDGNLWDSALEEAQDIDSRYRDSGQGIGSSDMNAFIANVLNGAGIKVGVVDNKYVRMAKGGALKYYDKDSDYRISRPSGSIEKDILEKVKYFSSSSQNFVGNFGWKTPQGKLADGYLYNLDEYDKSLVEKIKLKDGERIFRYFNRTSAIGGMTPMIKINLDKELIYFSVDNENDEIIFETKGTQALWISLIQDKMSEGGYMARGGEITVKVGDMVKSKKGVDGEVYESTGSMFKLKDDYGGKNPKWYSTRDFKSSEIKTMAEGGKLDFDYELKIQPDYKYKNIANRWLEDNSKDSIKYKLAILLLREKRNPDEILGIKSDSQYARLLRSLEKAKGESKHEGSWRTENYTLSQAEDWTRESLRDIFYVHADKSKMADGGETEDGVDLFEDYDSIPRNVQSVLHRYSAAFEDGDYRDLEKAHKALLKIGYTFEYGLDGQAYDLRKIGQKGKSEYMASGGYMAKGGEFPSIGDIIHPKDIDYDIMNYLMRTNKKLLVTLKNGEKIHSTVGKYYDDLIFHGKFPSKIADNNYTIQIKNFDKIEIIADNEMADGGYMANGGEVKPYIIWVSKDGEKREIYGTYKSQRAAEMKMNKIWESGEYNSIGNKPKEMYEKNGLYAKGGVTFDDKVKAVKSSLLKRKKVSPKVQKDYGKTFSPKEAEESAKRIVGAMTARERMKMKTKKK